MYVNHVFLACKNKDLHDEPFIYSINDENIFSLYFVRDRMTIVSSKVIIRILHTRESNLIIKFTTVVPDTVVNTKYIRLLV